MAAWAPWAIILPLRIFRSLRRTSICFIFFPRAQHPNGALRIFHELYEQRCFLPEDSLGKSSRVVESLGLLDRSLGEEMIELFELQEHSFLVKILHVQIEQLLLGRLSPPLLLRHFFDP